MNNRSGAQIVSQYLHCLLMRNMSANILQLNTISIAFHTSATTSCCVCPAIIRIFKLSKHMSYVRPGSRLEFACCVLSEFHILLHAAGNHSKQAGDSVVCRCLAKRTNAIDLWRKYVTTHIDEYYAYSTGLGDRKKYIFFQSGLASRNRTRMFLLPVCLLTVLSKDLFPAARRITMDFSCLLTLRSKLCRSR